MSGLALRVIVGDLAAYAALERRVEAADTDGIIARWEFGRALLAERQANGSGKQLPNGRIDEVCRAVGKPRTAFTRELHWRMKFAETYPTSEEVGTAVLTFGCWTAIRDSFTDEERLAFRKKPNLWLWEEWKRRVGHIPQPEWTGSLTRFCVDPYEPFPRDPGMLRQEIAGCEARLAKLRLMLDGSCSEGSQWCADMGGCGGDN